MQQRYARKYVSDINGRASVRNLQHMHAGMMHDALLQKTGVGWGWGQERARP